MQRTPLELACLSKRVDIVHVLLDKGANTRVTSVCTEFLENCIASQTGKTKQTNPKQGQNSPACAKNKGKFEVSTEDFSNLALECERQRAQIRDLTEENQMLKAALGETASPKRKGKKPLKTMTDPNYATAIDTLAKTRQFNQIYRRDDMEAFQIHGVLGSGCSGIVFDCSVPQIVNRKMVAMHRVALKMLLNFDDFNTYQIAQVGQCEYDILWSVKDVHPNILPILSQFVGRPTQKMMDLCESKCHLELMFNPQEDNYKTTQFYITEKMECTLEEKLKQNLKTKQKRKYALQISSALKFLHKHHIVHRDIKPNNILVSCDDTIVLSDFGCCIQLDENYCATLDGIGNPTFIAPELCEQAKNGLKSIDYTSQYSWELGLMIYFICCGELPYQYEPLVFSNRMQLELTERFRGLLARAVLLNPLTRIPFPEFCTRLEKVRFYN